VAPSWPLRLMQVQVCLVYFTSGLAKQRGTDWLTGVASLRAMLNPTVSRLSFDTVLSHAWFFKSAIFKMGEQVTLYWELLFPLFLFQRHLRNAALAFGVVAHLSIFFLFQVHFFSFAMVATYLCLAPKGWIPVVDGWVATIERRWNGLFVEETLPRTPQKPKDEPAAIAA